MSGTKCAPTRLTRRELARIQAALERASEINGILAQAAAATTRCRQTLEGIEVTVRERLGAIPRAAERARQEVDALRSEISVQVLRVQQGLDRALEARNARGLPTIDDRTCRKARDLAGRVRALDELAERLSDLAGQVTGGDAAAECLRARRRKARLESMLLQLRSRLADDHSYRWVSQEAGQVLEDGFRRLPEAVDDEVCTGFEVRLEALRVRAFEAERLYHQRRRTVDLVRQLFVDHGFHVCRAADPPHGRTEDACSAFRPTEEHLLVTVATRHPWGTDEQGQQMLHLTMQARSGSEQTADPLCIERLRTFILRARELGLEIGDVLQPLPGGGYECVLSSESVLADQNPHAASAGHLQARGF